jgi:hypothetical protein
MFVNLYYFCNRFFEVGLYEVMEEGVEWEYGNDGLRDRKALGYEWKKLFYIMLLIISIYFSKEIVDVEGMYKWLNYEQWINLVDNMIYINKIQSFC